ncbi:hypothetical protein BDN72DRAFT_806314 [Pluteus cervinus]|uniref:Uncharacterized protein n=1 Tax=Pluteus cervinus TaxID=181527 RepID=A0ACD2ZZR6_9AGAR|nr:hypothetical protein BDN72DRAFT_806314 [Pluteus cervinus]
MESTTLPRTVLQISTWDMPPQLIDPRPIIVAGDDGEGDADVSENGIANQDGASPSPLGSPRLAILEPPTQPNVVDQINEDDASDQDGEELEVPIPPPTPPRPRNRSSRHRTVSIRTLGSNSLAPSSTPDLPYIRVVDLSPPSSDYSDRVDHGRVAQLDSDTETTAGVGSGPGAPFGALMSASPLGIPWSTQATQFQQQYTSSPYVQMGPTYQVPVTASSWSWSRGSQEYPAGVDGNGFQAVPVNWGAPITDTRGDHVTERHAAGNTGAEEHPEPRVSKSSWKVTKKVKKWIGNVVDRPPNPQAEEWLAVVIYNRNKQFVYSVHGQNSNPIPKFLPKLPSHWKKPNPTRPSPPCTSLVLNSLLKHAILGSVRIYWNIALCPDIVAHDRGRQKVVFLADIELEEPATCPLVRELRIVGVAEDHEWPFPWPFIVKNNEGVTIADVLNKIYANFKEFVGKTELDKLGCFRVEKAKVMHWLRASKLPQGDPGRSMMRVDCMCGSTIFRGLEPHPESGGYLLHLGLG